ncbi:membrane protease YdiL (CAAX protease family) [Natronospira proteinivora]|uniref:Membrane protease YdiL (CAAX protease family) n=1 Tax=Natronospira proteinivora TaxID=1807133 RepID=A0ABT1G9I9_9GAMM|nr:CPBP family intramembrane glutamic endopeptidase [Natronospira proteinivora]MCP1727570.1 membrane protease YdiL (CAAX protease family) [Natronospira proteinivora]
MIDIMIANNHTDSLYEKSKLASLVFAVGVTAVFSVIFFCVLVATDFMDAPMLVRAVSFALSGLALVAVVLLWKPDYLSDSRVGWKGRPVIAFLVGAGSCGVLAVLGLSFGVLIGDYQLILSPLTAAGLSALLVHMIIVLIAEAIPEEFVFRKLVLNSLAVGFRLWASVIIQAFLFMGMAFSLIGLQSIFGITPEWSINWDRVVLFLSFGIVLALARIVAGSVWASIGFHMVFQGLVQLFVGGRFPGATAEPVTAGEYVAINIWLFSVLIGGIIFTAFLFFRSRLKDKSKPC